MRVSRKAKREKQLIERKIVKEALRDGAIKREWDKRFIDGIEVGKKHTERLTLDLLRDWKFLTEEQVDEYVKRRMEKGGSSATFL